MQMRKADGAGDGGQEPHLPLRAGVHTATLPNLPDGTFDIAALKKAAKNYDPHYPLPLLPGLHKENTHNIMGGKIVPWSGWTRRLASHAK